MVDRLQRRADTVSQYGTALQDLAKAAQPLYQSLDDAQKRRVRRAQPLPRRRLGIMAMGVWRHGMAATASGITVPASTSSTAVAVAPQDPPPPAIALPS